jgi:Zn-dependent peptidase ImmA (M78 family)
MLWLPCNVIEMIRDGDMTVDILPLHHEINGLLWRKHIAINKDISWYEKRFTLCHEFSHYFLWHCPTHASKFQEKEADNFAITLLVPDHELIEELEKYEGDTTMLEKVFWIPREILQKRILEIYNK